MSDADSPQVLRVAGPTATVAHGDAIYEARIGPRLPGRPLVVGDRVQWRVAGDERVITAIEPRETLLERASGPDGPRRPIVANAEILLIVESLHNPPPRPTLIDRYLVAGFVGNMTPIIVLTKSDVADPQVAADLAGLYRGLGYTVAVGCAKDADFVEQLRGLIDGRVAALVGQSGVGKSTLTRRLTGVDRAVGEVSEQIGGRHTTSDPRQIPLIGGGWVVDTAGVRSLFLPPLDPRDVGDAFPEVRDNRHGCRFRDCRHLNDAGCAVDGHFAPTRRESYRILVQVP